MLKLCRACLFSSKKSKIQIPFNFKLPSQPLQPEPELNVSSKVVAKKIKRKGIERFGLKEAEPSYSSEQDHKSETQKQYQEELAQKQQENMATQRFYKHQLERGQDLIDDIPVEPYYQYKIEDLKQSLEDRQDEYKKCLNISKLVDPSRPDKLRKILNGYQQSKHRFQLEQFEKYLDKYPGSLKGRYPEEDPEAFSKYAREKMPAWLEAELSLENKEMRIDEENGEAEGSEGMNIGHISDYMGNDRQFHYPKDEDDTAEMITESIRNDFANSKNIVQYSEIPYSPEVNFEQFHSHFFKTRLWGKFRSFYEVRILEKKYAELEKILDKAHEQHVEMTGTDQYQVPSAAYSLFTYYKTLPKEIQENPAVRTTYLGLEYSQPDISYAEKQETLNKAAAMSLPLDKFSQAAMDELIEKKKFYLTPHLVDRIFNIHPEFTWDIHEFLRQVKEEKLRSMSTVKEKEQSFPQPPQPHLAWEEGMANLPVDFYDNDDGFWDDYIGEKLEKYQKVQPLLNRPKTHFIH